MSALLLLQILSWIWAAFGIYWLFAARGGKAAQTAENPLHRLGRLAVLVITFTLLFAEHVRIGPLGYRFLPRIPAVAISGFVLTLAGMAVAVWARVHLGQYWSDKVVLKMDHQLIRTGPYARIRHPIYSGVLLGVGATAIVLGEWRGVIAFALLLTNYSIKARREEDVLASAFGEQFVAQKRRTGFLFPRLRSGN
jgi:protein-S-isoprenylcysteine O-methyltransferase Ste14